MDSPSYCLNFVKSEGNLMEGLSPMTDLAKNLSSLSTTRTPCRRISWNNQDDAKSFCFGLDDSPFVADSPSFQGGILREGESKYKKMNQSSRKFLFKRGSSQDKENCEHFVNSSKLYSDESPPDGSQSDLSQESGFCDEKRTELSFVSTASVPSGRGSMFTDDETEDDFFGMDKLLEDDSLPSAMSSSINQLLTKPLSDCANGNWGLTGRRRRISPRKPVVRRFLSLLESSSSLSDNYAETESFDVELSFGEESMKAVKSKTSFKRPEPVHGSTPIHCKRRKSSPAVEIPTSPFVRTSLHRCYSETAATIMKAVQKSDEEPNLVGDGSRMYALPLIHNGRHQDLKTISSNTLLRVIKGEFLSIVMHYAIIDCRYPYEYEGGHIKQAKNIYTKEELQQTLLSNMELPKRDQPSLIIFHCEFSSERAPKLLRFLRNKDREINESNYPRLHHPEIYLLEGGYKEFFEKYPEHCDPQSYKPMLHKDHASELREFRSKSKSFGNDVKYRPKLRSNLKF